VQDQKLSRGRDCLSTIKALQQLGVTIERPTRIRCGLRLARKLIAPEGDIDCGNSGTTMRLLAGILAAQPFTARMIGDAWLSKRPMRRIIEPLHAKWAQPSRPWA
jgi:3-phosphoshikimate 1-carboxyvinyltransferase